MKWCLLGRLIVLLRRSTCGWARCLEVVHHLGEGRLAGFDRNICWDGRGLLFSLLTLARRWCIAFFLNLGLSWFARLLFLDLCRFCIFGIWVEFTNFPGAFLLGWGCSGVGGGGGVGRLRGVVILGSGRLSRRCRSRCSNTFTNFAVGDGDGIVGQILRGRGGT